MEDKLADKIMLRDTKQLIAKSILEFDALMIKIEDFRKTYPALEMNAVAEFSTMHTKLQCESTDTRKLTAKRIIDWHEFVNRVREIENELLEAINKDRPKDVDPIEYVFDCTVTLKIEKKDKEAQRVLDDPMQLKMFGPLIIPEEDKDRIKFVKDNKHLFDGLKPDGKEISEINFKHVNTDTGEVTGEVTLTADSKAMEMKE